MICVKAFIVISVGMLSLGCASSESKDAAPGDLTETPQVQFDELAAQDPSLMESNVAAFTQQIEKTLADRQAAAAAAPTTQPVAVNEPMEVESPAQANTPAAQLAAAPTSAPDAPGGSFGPPELGPLFRRLAELNREASETPDDLATQFAAHRIEQLLGQSKADAFADLNGEDRRLLETVCAGLDRFYASLRASPKALPHEKALPLLDLADELDMASGLRIENAVLCTRVKDFGVYDPIASNQFVAGPPVKFLLYAEIENFGSRQEGDQWITELTSDATLYSLDGTVQWTDDSRTSRDTCRKKRNDFFINWRVELPETLVMGTYLLKVTVMDEQTKRVAEKTVEFRVVASSRASK